MLVLFTKYLIFYPLRFLRGYFFALRLKNRFFSSPVI
nr:MAG TPA: hypothetical protein [Caudoviricetes sp.]